MKRILVVDGNKRIRDLMADLILEYFPGTELSFASNGSEALKYFQGVSHRPFDLVITGIIMPVMDGWCLIANLKNNWPILPILIVSGLPKPTWHRADYFICKPFDTDRLVNKIRQLLRAA